MDVNIFLVASGFVAGIGAGFGVYRWRNRTYAVEESLDARQTTFIFSGNLKQTNLLEAIQFLEIGQREGILHIYSKRRKGYLTFSHGQVIDAFYRNETGRSAVLAMLGLEDGDFYFEPKNVVQPQIIADSIMDIAIEWGNQTEELGSP